jgi:cellobiose-specific phosphotransferase system component IIA
MSTSDFCLKCDKELSVYCGPCMDAERNRSSESNDFAKALNVEIERLHQRIEEVVKAHLAAIGLLKRQQAEATAKLISLLIGARRHLSTVAASDDLVDLCKQIDEVIGHRWGNFGDFTVCGKCGVIRRADDANKPCRGEVEVTLRGEERVTSLEKQVSLLRSFADDMAENDCHYGDGCPKFGSRHGQCVGCKAREVLGKTDPSSA